MDLSSLWASLTNVLAIKSLKNSVKPKKVTKKLGVLALKPNTLILKKELWDMGFDPEVEEYDKRHNVLMVECEENEIEAMRVFMTILHDRFQMQRN